MALKRNARGFDFMLFKLWRVAPMSLSVHFYPFLLASGFHRLLVLQNHLTASDSDQKLAITLLCLRSVYAILYH